MAREMKDSGSKWIGMIPNDWDTIPVKRCFKIENGSDPVTKEGPVPVYGSGAQSFKTCVEYKEGPTVLLGRKGTINIPRWVNGKYWNVDTAFNVKSISGYDMRLFYYAATCFDYDTYSTQTALPSMTQSEYESIKLPLVSNAKEIVDLLDNSCNKITDAISRHQAIIEKLEEYKRSIITHAVTKGLNPAVETKTMDSPWIGKIPSHWKVAPLWTLYSERKNKNSDGLEQNLLSLSYGNIIRKNINTNEGLLPKNFNGYNIIEKDDIVLRLTDLQNDKRSLRTGLVKEHGIITSAYVTLEAKQKLSSEYYHYLLHAYDIMKGFYSMGEGVRQNLGYAELSKMKLPMPSIVEQQEIAEYLNSICVQIADAISRQKAAIEKLEEYKKSLIYNVVTGKIDCREVFYNEA